MKNLENNYFKTSYGSHFKEKIGFTNNSPKSSKKGSGFSDTKRLNEYKVNKGIPDQSNYISACYPPIPIGISGTNNEYTRLKKYTPIYLMEKRNQAINNYPETRPKNPSKNPNSAIPDIDEEWFLRCKKDKKELYKRTKSLQSNIKNVNNKTFDSRKVILAFPNIIEKFNDH
jgi:hypothetical protein